MARAGQNASARVNRCAIGVDQFSTPRLWTRCFRADFRAREFEHGGGLKPSENHAMSGDERGHHRNARSMKSRPIRVRRHGNAPQDPAGAQSLRLEGLYVKAVRKQRPEGPVREHKPSCKPRRLQLRETLGPARASTRRRCRPARARDRATPPSRRQSRFVTTKTTTGCATLTSTRSTSGARAARRMPAMVRKPLIACRDKYRRLVIDNPEDQLGWRLAAISTQLLLTVVPAAASTQPEAGPASSSRSDARPTPPCRSVSTRPKASTTTSADPPTAACVMSHARDGRSVGLK